MKKEMESPYLNARREWNERYGNYIKERDTYRQLAIGGILIGIIGVCGAVFMGMQVKVVPYAVELNANSEVVRVSRADVMPDPTTNQIRAALNSLVIGTRVVYADRRAQQRAIVDSYAMIAPDSPAYKAASSYHTANSPYVRSQTETVDIQIDSINAISPDTWRVDWIETTRQLSGNVTDVKRWTGNFTVVTAPPADESQILINPLGIYVTNLSWATRL